MSLLPVAEAQAQLLALRPALPAETLPLDACIGRWLSADITALRDQPWADLSAMDGYAVRADDLAGPWTVIGESTAGGQVPAALKPGEAMRIFTGAPMPQGEGAVLIQENAIREGSALSLLPGSALRPTLYVRQHQSDFGKGQVLLAAGEHLGPAQLALATMAGHAALPVRSRPRIAMLSTGSELAEPGAALAEGQIPSSNAIMLRAMLAALPCDSIDLGAVPDDMPRLIASLEAARGSDIIVTSGGASVGDHDLVQDALREMGGTLAFWKVRMRPGKPLIVGRIGDSVFLGLPGNPASAFVTALLFLLPLVRHLAGSRSPLPTLHNRQLGSAMPPGEDRDEYRRACIINGHVEPLSNRDSASLRSLAQADALIVRPAGCPAAQIGEIVPTISLY